MALGMMYWLSEISTLNERKFEIALRTMRERGLDPNAISIRKESVDKLPEWLTKRFPVHEILDTNLDVKYVAFYRRDDDK